MGRAVRLDYMLAVDEDLLGETSVTGTYQDWCPRTPASGSIFRVATIRPESRTP